jgi:hypothetical protein
VKIEWTKSGGAVAVLGDDTAAARKTIYIMDWGGAAAVQVEPLFRGAHPFLAGRGNVSGQFVFSTKCSYGTMDAAVAAFFAEYARIGETGSMVITTVDKVISYANAFLVSVKRGGKEGVLLEVVYTFIIRSGSIA